MLLRLFSRHILLVLVAAVLSLGDTGPAFGDIRIGPDLEKPIPVFTRERDTVSAKLIPRAKSTSVLIHFKVSGGTLADVSGIDFFLADRPEVDVKNFKSALFQTRIDGVPVGGEVEISISSDFFNSATQYFVFNDTLTNPWSDSNARNVSHPNRVQELIIAVKDGGKFDADGNADGKITFVGGPRDSFWGYALGTLFIRFFGLFLVLGVLMAGMIVSGKFFQWYLARKLPPPPPTRPLADAAIAMLPHENEGPENNMEDDDALRKKAAVIAVALHLHQGSLKKASSAVFRVQPASDAWTQSGRSQMMGERLMIFNRQPTKAI